MVTNNFILLAISFLIVMMGIWIYFVSQDARRTQRNLRQTSQQHTLINTDERARQLCIAIHQLHPDMHAGVDFIIKTDGPDAEPYLAEWYGTAPKPTLDQLQSAFSKVAGKDFVELRKAEYPSVGDQLDAAYKARHGDDSEQVDLDHLITEIKARYPDPGACD